MEFDAGVMPTNWAFFDNVKLNRTIGINSINGVN